MEDFAVGGREHAQSPEGARGRWLGILRGVACLERGPARRGAGSRDVGSLSSRRESRERAGRIGGLKRDRIRNPVGKVARDTGDRGEELERPAEGAGLKPGAGRETLDLSGFAVALRVAQSADTCALLALRPTSASLSLQHPVRGHWGRGPTAGLTRTVRAAETPLLNQQLDRDPKRTR